MFCFATISAADRNNNPMSSPRQVRSMLICGPFSASSKRFVPIVAEAPYRRKAEDLRHHGNERNPIAHTAQQCRTTPNNDSVDLRTSRNLHETGAPHPIAFPLFARASPSSATSLMSDDRTAALGSCSGTGEIHPRRIVAQGRTDDHLRRSQIDA